MKIKKVAVVLPCLNEEKTVSDVIDKIKDVSKKLKINFIIVAVDDASDDNTLKILKKKIKTVVSLKERVSLAEVIRQGLKEALKHKPDIVIHIDADGQYNPKEIPKLISPIYKNQADFVLGTRDIWALDHMPFKKKFGNSFFSFLMSLMLKRRITDAQTGFRAMSYEAAKDLILIASYTYTQEELIRISKKGYKIKEVPISFRKRKHGRSRLVLSSFRYGLFVLKDLIKIMTERN
ncbi:glycosyltransferase family 2 protein [Candidatus Woesearchaeota archaeon]|nr:glycosyltransferase family 2 protein [Candidatus Woesearchaeota archaeon]